MIQYIKTIFITVLIFSTIGCKEEFLDTTPTNAISASDALSGAANMKLVLNGLHRQLYAQSQLPGGSTSRSGQQYFIPMFDVMAGELIHSSPGNGWMTSDLRWITHLSSGYTTVEQFWYQRYHVIGSVNAIIKKIEEGEIAIDADVNNILGQCYAYRAWAYHQLVSTFGKGYIIGSPSTDKGVPLLLSTDAPYESKARSTVAEVYSQIESDINEAISYFGDASGPDDKSHLSINAAYGIQARIALSKGDWSTAATAAKNARTDFELLDESAWRSGFNSVDLSEVIWGGTVIDSETAYYTSYFYYICPTFNGSQNRSNPKIIRSDIYDQIPETDFRKKAWLPLAPNTNSSASNGEGGSYESDPNYDNEEDFDAAWLDIITTYGMTTAHNTHPYMTVKFLQKNPGTIDPDDVIYMRSSEMYLIEAEAKTMLGDISGAQDVLNEFASTRDSEYDISAFSSEESLMEQIKFQRKVELWGEGFAWHDHIRWDEGIDLSESGAASVLYQDGYLQAKPSENDNWVWKIPQSEIDSNNNISESDQN